MLKKSITYTDYNGVSRTDDFYFNLSMREIMNMELGGKDAYSKTLETLTATSNVGEIISAVEDLIAKSFGTKSEDGRSFIKNPEATEAFMNSEAYTELLFEFATDANAAADFVRGILPKDFEKRVSALEATAGMNTK